MKRVFSSFFAVLLSLCICATSVGAATLEGFGYKNSSNEVTDYPVLGAVTVEADASGDTGETTAKLLTAIYDDKTGELLNVSFSNEADISGGKSAKLSAAMNIESIDGVIVKNFIWDSTGSLKPLLSSKIITLKLSVVEGNGYRVLAWDPSDIVDAMTYSVYADGVKIAENIEAHVGSYTDKVARTQATSYQVKSFVDGKINGVSNIVNSTPNEMPVAPVAPSGDPAESGSTDEWNFNTTATISSVDGYSFTDSQVKLVEGENWTITDSDYSYNNNVWDEKQLDENAIVLYRGTAHSYLVIVFGDEIRQSSTVTLSFDFWGSRLNQSDKLYYGSNGVEANQTVRVDKAYTHYSVTAETDFELTDYGYPGQYGAVIRYSRSYGDPEHDSFWIKNIVVSSDKADTFCATITADSTGASYKDIYPAGNRLSDTHGNAIAGTVLRTSSSQWHYAVGYDYRTVDGTDAFYLTQMYDTTGTWTQYPVTQGSKGFLAFTVKTNRFAKKPDTLSGAYVSLTYYDGTVGDITTKPFNVYVSENSGTLDPSATLVGSVSMTGGNAWKTVSFPIPEGVVFNNGNDFGADISMRTADSSAVYNKNGILLKSLSIMDEAYYNDVYSEWETYYSDYAAYESALADFEDSGALKYPNGVSLDFNADADGTIKQAEWEDVSLTGLAFCSDAGNMPNEGAYRCFSYGEYGPENDRRYAISTASYIDKRAELGRPTYFYFKADGKYITSDVQYVEVEVTYLDSSTDDMVLLVRPKAGASYEYYKLPQTETGVWKTAVFRVDKAAFMKNDEGFGGDFRLSLATNSTDPNQLIVSDITVRNICGKTLAAPTINATPTIYIAGDSIAADYTDYDGGRPEEGSRYGWGEKLSFNGVEIENKAVPGQTANGFDFDGIMRAIAKNDYVFISFGHNDASASVSINEYKADLKAMIAKVLSKGATPVILTSIPTIHNGRVELDYSYSDDNNETTPSSIASYRAAAMEVAAECSVLGFDLGTAFAGSLSALESNEARMAYFVDEGGNRRVHLSEEGAQCVAELIANAVKNSSKIRRLK